MLSNKVGAIELAAGKSTRFKTGRTKLLEKICGQEMILYSTKLLESLDIPTTLVVGYQRDIVMDLVKKKHGDFVSFVVQEDQKGTGHAVRCTREHWQREHILVMNGDMPLVTSSIIQELYDKHIATQADISIVISHADESQVKGYGRIVETDNGIKIVEAKDWMGQPQEICCINAGIYLFKKSFLEEYIDQLTENAKTKELYLTDLIKMACDNGLKVTTISAPFDHIRGINTFQELWAAEQVKRSELIKYWMDNGVHFSMPQTVYLDLYVTIGVGSSVGAGVHLLGNTRIGKNCKINEYTTLSNSTIGDNTQVYAHCVINDSQIGEHCEVGPFAHVREQSHIGNINAIGNFVEVKQTSIGDGSKAKHLAYLGDAQIGSQVNIGAGTVICNHNGKTKHKTLIANKAYIGSNSTLVAPLDVGEGGFVGAGSVVTEPVPAHALAIARAKQVNKIGYAKKLLHEKSDDCACSTGNESQAMSFIGALKTKSSTNNL